MVTEIIRYENQLPSDGDWDKMYKMAQSIAKTDLVPKALDTAEKVLAVALTGRELGLGFMTSVRSLNVIQGKVEMSAQLMLALAINTGQVENHSIRGDATTATFVVKRRGVKEYSSTFTIADAKAMGLISRDQWTKQPATMLRWRAISAGLRLIFPDVLLGVYSPGEIMEVDTTTGEILEGAAHEVPGNDITIEQASGAIDYGGAMKIEPSHSSAPAGQDVQLDKGKALHTLRKVAEAVYGAADKGESLNRLALDEYSAHVLAELTLEQIAELTGQLTTVLDARLEKAQA